MRFLLLLISLGAVVAVSLAETPQDDGVGKTKAQQYKMVHAKKLVLAQIARIKHTDQPDDVKKAEIQGIYQRYKAALHGDNEEASLLAAQRELVKHVGPHIPAEGKPVGEEEEEEKEEEAPVEGRGEEQPKSHSEEVASTMKRLGFKHSDHRKGMKRGHMGASLKRLAQDATSHDAKSRRRRSLHSAKPLRTSFARPT